MLSHITSECERYIWIVYMSVVQGFPVSSLWCNNTTLIMPEMPCRVNTINSFFLLIVQLQISWHGFLPEYLHVLFWLIKQITFPVGSCSCTQYWINNPWDYLNLNQKCRQWDKTMRRWHWKWTPMLYLIYPTFNFSGKCETSTGKYLSYGTARNYHFRTFDDSCVVSLKCTRTEYSKCFLKSD